MTFEVRLQEALQLLLLPSWNQPSTEEAQLACWLSGERKYQAKAPPFRPPARASPSSQPPDHKHVSEMSQHQVEHRWAIPTESAQIVDPKNESK